MNRLAAIALMTFASCCLSACGEPDSGDGWERSAFGVVITPASGPAARVRIEAIADDILRVTAFPTAATSLPESLMIVHGPAVPFRIEAADDALSVITDRARATVSLDNGLVRLFNAAGDEVLAESGRAGFEPVTVEGSDYYALRQQWNRGTDEAFYGLGQHQNGQFDYNGEDVELAQHNIVIAMPFVVSARNYGVLWDNNSLSRFGDPRPYGGLADRLVVRGADGEEGGLTARYFVAGELVAERREPDPNYQFLKDQGNWPEGISQGTPGLSVTWEGSIESATGGPHKFRLYQSGYTKLTVDDQLVVDNWKQNWNPWYTNVTVELEAGKPRNIRIEWQVDGGFLRLEHQDPEPADDRHSLRLYSELGRAIDYYFVSGESLGDVVAGYRRLTGATRMLPRRAYGFWQSRERYQTQDELLGALREYRRLGIPIDNIVLDWFYWPEDAWGSHEFDASRFPDPQAMIDAVHELDANVMISVWPKFYPTTDNYRELDALGAVYPHTIDTAQVDWVGPGYVSTFYDPYSAAARRTYWRQVREKLAVLGFDAWWMDATEPDLGSNADIDERKARMTPTALGPGAAFFNSYTLLNSQAVFDGLQEMDADKRVMILTRSGFPGVQRYGAAVWSGDIVSTWTDFANQVPAGLNIGLSGLANWTFDIGGFTPENRYAYGEIDAMDLAEWRELNTRWFQFGAFAPLFRSHGQYPYREIYNIAPAGSPEYESMAWYARLRYRLLPYIYTLAADVARGHGTIMRPLVMEFPDDPAAAGIGDEYLFGPSLLVRPVTEYGARTADVHLPAGADWVDFHTGERHEGGWTIEAAAPLERMPLFVRTGTILPVGPEVQSSRQDTHGELTLLVFTGADGRFELYEDDGETYAYLRGEHALIPLAYDDASGTLTIGARVGAFDGMASQRRISVRWIDGATPAPGDFDAPADAGIDYNGTPVTIVRDEGP